MHAGSVQLPDGFRVLADRAVGREHARRGDVVKALFAEGYAVLPIRERMKAGFTVAFKIAQNEIVVRTVPALAQHQRSRRTQPRLPAYQRPAGQCPR